MITYCTNIHPGESWEETFGNLARHLPAVKSAVSPDAPFPVGLRLSGRAARELTPEAAARFGRWLAEHDLFVPTINAFPFGSFHQTSVKEQVYRPDWRHPQRAAYTVRLANLLAGWLPDGMRGSLSSVPIAFKKGFVDCDLAAVRANLVSVLEHLDRLHEESGKEILLALEPEPCCVLETTSELVQFVERLQLPGRLRHRLGVCLDCCHLAVEFEEPAQVLAQLSGAGIPIAKIQASSAPSIAPPDPAVLALFDEPCYLHQVVIRGSDGRLSRYADLPEALKTHRSAQGEEWRVHFHIPIFLDQKTPFGTTRSFIEELVPLVKGDPLFEVETYSFAVLPAELAGESVTQSLIREIAWLKGVHHAALRGT